MKKVILLLLLSINFAACSPKQIQTLSFDKPLKDSIITLKAKNDTLLYSTYKLQEVIASQQKKLDSLNNAINEYKLKTFMSTSDFIELYKFSWLLRYYNLCNKKPTYWKYYKGWSTRVFEAQNKNYKPTDYVPDATLIPGFK